jgi:hypothetical protein
MDYDLRHPPWSPGEMVSEDVFLRNVIDALASVGRWSTYAEFRMGAGPTVTVSFVSRGDQQIFRAEAVWMRWAFKISGDYDSLDGALTALPLYGRAMFEVLSANGDRGLVDSD